MARKSEPVTVTAPLVLVSVEGGRTVYAYEGDVLPDDATKESVEHLRRRGFLSTSDEPSENGK